MTDAGDGMGQPPSGAEAAECSRAGCTVSRRVIRRSSVGVGLVLGLGALAAYWVFKHASAPAPRPEALTKRIDPNTASREELMLLPRVGGVTADAIIEFRTAAPTKPAFARAEDLDRVPRIGPKTIDRLRPVLIFSSEDPLPREVAASP